VGSALRDSLQYMLNRGQIARSGSVVPAVTLMVRIPPNGAEKAQFTPSRRSTSAPTASCGRISRQSRRPNAVAACRYPRASRTSHSEPQGIRGDGPTQAVRYWGVSQQEYYDRADVWPLNPKGRFS
jgi:4-hydroxy-2-oxoheptanedioate aldolase